MKKKIFSLYTLAFYIFIFSFSNGYSQPLLTLQDAIAIASSQSGVVKINQLNEEISAKQVYKANVGLTPKIDLNANLATTGNYVNLSFIDGRTINRFGRILAPNANVSLSWLLYDGKQAITKYKMFGVQNDIVKIQSQHFLDQLKYQVSYAYYNIAKQKKSIEYLNNTLKYYNERLQITEERWKIGKGSKLDFLQSQNDYNTQISSINSAKLNLQNAKVLLNDLLNRSPATPFDTEELAENVSILSAEAVLKEAIAKDENLAAIQRSIDLQKLQEKVIEANQKPKVGLISSLGYNFTNNNAGQILLNQNFGLNAGVAASWNLYDGNHNKNQLAITKLHTDILNKEFENATHELNTQIALAFNQWETDKLNLKLEESNKKIAEENLSIALEKFKLGASTILELNDAQQRYDLAINRYVQSLFAEKFSTLAIEKITY